MYKPFLQNIWSATKRSPVLVYFLRACIRNAPPWSVSVFFLFLFFHSFLCFRFFIPPPFLFWHVQAKRQSVDTGRGWSTEVPPQISGSAASKVCIAAGGRQCRAPLRSYAVQLHHSSVRTASTAGERQTLMKARVAACLARVHECAWHLHGICTAFACMCCRILQFINSNMKHAFPILFNFNF